MEQAGPMSFTDGLAKLKDWDHDAKFEHPIITSPSVDVATDGTSGFVRGAIASGVFNEKDCTCDFSGNRKRGHH